MSERITIGWLFPSSLSTYGDRGNVMALVQRARWRGIESTVVAIDGEDAIDSSIDVFFVGGGSDAAQTRVGRSLSGSFGRRLVELVREGRALLAICGGYQLLCHEYVTADDVRIPGAGLFDAVTYGGAKRLVGKVRLATRWGEVVGFENHSGRTYPSDGTEPLGRVLSGYGNNGDDRSEGLVVGAAIASYLHGPLLPSNPALADWLLTQGIAWRDPGFVLEPLTGDLDTFGGAGVSMNGSRSAVQSGHS